MSALPPAALLGGLLRTSAALAAAALTRFGASAACHAEQGGPATRPGAENSTVNDEPSGGLCYEETRADHHCHGPAFGRWISASAGGPRRGRPRGRGGSRRRPRA